VRLTGEDGSVKVRARVVIGPSVVPAVFLSAGQSLFCSYLLGFVAVANVAAHFDYDPFSYPKLAPLPRISRSLASQINSAFVRRSFPFRWGMTCTATAGMFGRWTGERQLIWNGQFVPLSPTVWGDLYTYPPSYSVLSVGSADDEDALYSLKLTDFTLGPTAYVIFNRVAPHDGNYAGVTFTEISVQGPNWSGTLNGTIALSQQVWFRDLR
jgi:hypothetical protein